MRGEGRIAGRAMRNSEMNILVKISMRFVPLEEGGGAKVDARLNKKPQGMM